jgi:cell division protein FtsI/penicillin-binding protein 2
MRAAKASDNQLVKAHKDKGAIVVMDPISGDVLALVSAPAPDAKSPTTPEELFDRARYGQYPPGSTFKLVTAMAALRLDPALENKSFSCRRLPDGRVGAIIPGWRKPIRDDVGDSAHGTLTMHRAIAVSCNAYFAQLGVFSVGAKQLSDTAKLLDIPAGSIPDIQAAMPFAAYGQGPLGDRSEQCSYGAAETDSRVRSCGVFGKRDAIRGSRRNRAAGDERRSC